MNLSKFLIILGISTGICWIAFLAVIFFINPIEVGWLAFVFFYVSLTFALIGSFSLLGILVRWLRHQDELVYKQMNIASRQSLLFTFLIVFALILQSGRYLTWWNLLILVALAVCVEIFFISYKKFNK